MNRFQRVKRVTADSRGGFGAAALVVAFGLSASFSAIAADPIRICHIDDRSGAAADTGNEGYNGLMLAVDAANAAGGVAGRKIEVTAYDGKTDPQLTATFATRCAEDDKGLLIIGGNPAAPAAAMIPVATQFGIPYYMLSAATDNLTDPPAPFHFRFGPANRQDAIAIADFLATQGFKRVAIVNNAVPFGTDGARAATAAVEKKGIKVVTQQTYDIAATDLSPQIINVREAKPELILVYSYPADAARVTRTIQQLGVKVPLVVVRVGLLETFRKLGGESADGVLVPTTVDVTRADVRKFFETYNARFKPVQPSPYAIQGNDAGNFAIQVLRQPEVQKAIDGGKLADARKAIRDATEKIGGQFKGLQGRQGASYQFSSATHHGSPDSNWFVFTQVTDKGTKLVSPDLSKISPKP
jgi:ABC-type branched-subunit amino acid transport system substrate-binding protein